MCMGIFWLQTSENSSLPQFVKVQWRAEIVRKGMLVKLPKGRLELPIQEQREVQASCLSTWPGAGGVRQKGIGLSALAWLGSSP